MSGGGANGAWEAGVLWGLAHYGNPDDYHWDVVTGISAGGFNSVFGVGFEPQDVLNMTEHISDVWLNFKNEDFYVPREGSFIHNQSLWDTSPMEDTIRGVMNQNPGYKKRITIGTAEVNTGEFLEWDQDNTTYYDMARVSVASAAVPIFFPPVEHEGHLLMDGGTIWDINLSSAINQCHQMGASNEEITVDMTYWLLRHKPGHAAGRTVHNWLEAWHTHFYYTGMNSSELE